MINKSIFFISEVSSNHSQNIDRALKFIDKSVSVGCSAVKFQSARKFVLTVDPIEFINHKIGPINKIINGLINDFIKYVDDTIEAFCLIRNLGRMS
jgi:hypothetical protein